MVKTLKFIFYIVLLFFAFFSGVKYSEQVRGLSDWLFEAKEQEVDFEEIKNNIRKDELQDSLQEKTDETFAEPTASPTPTVVTPAQIEENKEVKGKAIENKIQDENKPVSTIPNSK